TLEQNGLRRKWRGRTWLNCPYSSPAPWATRLLNFYQAGDVPAAVALFNARSSSGWFHLLAPHAWRCEPWSRIKFWGPATHGGNGMQDQVYFYLGPEPERFCAVFAAEGRLVAPSVTLAVTRSCSACGRSLAGLRADSQTCSSACRQRAYRRRAHT